MLKKVKREPKKKEEVPQEPEIITPNRPGWVDVGLWNSLDDNGKINLINGK